jgi:N6-L-threonylcarbamoyladenine synthase
MLVHLYHQLRSTTPKHVHTFHGQLSTLHPRFNRRFTVLALESSADDTCAAVVTSEREILSNVVIKQLDQ